MTARHRGTGWYEIAVCALLLVALSGCMAAARMPGAAALCIRGTGSDVETPSSILRKVDQRFAETPFIRVSARIDISGKNIFEARSLMGPDRNRLEVRSGGVLVVALYSDSSRVQEYAPSAKFTTGLTADHVLLEYDNTEKGVGWLRLIDQDTACEFGLMVESWLVARPHTMGQRLADAVHGADLTQENLGNHDCYRLHKELILESDDKGNAITTFKSDVYIDRGTFDLVRWTRQQVGAGGKEQTRRCDYEVEHSPNDKDWTWRLGAGQFQDTSPAPSK